MQPNTSDFPVIVAVIPTCNRPDLLIGLLQNINEQILKLNKVIVVDSSDTPINNFPSYKFKLDYHHVNVKSAAIQRNIGISNVNNTAQYLAFLDDDIRIPIDYFEKLFKIISQNDAVGVSGIANNSDVSNGRKFIRIANLAKTIFFLSSKLGGTITKGAVNVPISKQDGKLTEVQWLIGCAFWNFQIVKLIRFEEDFMGQSLGEDVIYSYRAHKFGKLLVDPSIHMEHLESPIQRPDLKSFWEMWAFNRSRLHCLMHGKERVNFSYWWCNFGQSLILLVKSLRDFSGGMASLRGLIKGSLRVIRG